MFTQLRPLRAFESVDLLFALGELSNLAFLHKTSLNSLTVAAKQISSHLTFGSLSSVEQSFTKWPKDAKK